VTRVAVNTTLSAAAGILAAAALTGTRFGRPDASLCANGWTGGLVASSAAGALVDPAVAAIIGAIAGGLVTLSVEWIDARLRVDDPAGSISVHAAAGLWGLLSVGIFARVPRDQWLAQLAGIVTLAGFVLPMTYSLNWLLNRCSPQRVSAEGDPHGLDLYELGAGADPEFVTRREDFRPR
jgi:Amt family ammonium transporter